MHFNYSNFQESDQVQANVESLGLNFTLPGYPDIELKVRVFVV